MTLDIDAIRARDAASYYPLSPSEIDRRDLLAEVDRLRAVRLEASESHVWLEGAATERARIRAAVEGLDFECVHDKDAVLAAIDGETT